MYELRSRSAKNVLSKRGGSDGLLSWYSLVEPEQPSKKDVPIRCSVPRLLRVDSERISICHSIMTGTLTFYHRTKSMRISG